MKTPTDAVCVCGHLQSRHWIKGLTNAGCRVDGCSCTIYLFKRHFYGQVQPFGWDVDVEIVRVTQAAMVQYHYRGCSKAVAIRKALMAARATPHLEVRLVKTAPLTEDQWVRAYGLGRM